MANMAINGDQAKEMLLGGNDPDPSLDPYQMEAGGGNTAGAGEQKDDPLLAAPSQQAQEQSWQADVNLGLFPLPEGERILKEWKAPQPSCVLLSRDNVSLIRTTHTVAFTAERVQPCCPVVVFASTLQHVTPESISCVTVRCVPLQHSVSRD